MDNWKHAIWATVVVLLVSAVIVISVLYSVKDTTTGWIRMTNYDDVPVHGTDADTHSTKMLVTGSVLPLDTLIYGSAVDGTPYTSNLPDSVNVLAADMNNVALLSKNMFQYIANKYPTSKYLDIQSNYIRGYTVKIYDASIEPVVNIFPPPLTNPTDATVAAIVGSQVITCTSTPVKGATTELCFGGGDPAANWGAANSPSYNNASLVAGLWMRKD